MQNTEFGASERRMRRKFSPHICICTRTRAHPRTHAHTRTHAYAPRLQRVCARRRDQPPYCGRVRGGDPNRAELRHGVCGGLRGGHIHGHERRFVLRFGAERSGVQVQNHKYVLFSFPFSHFCPFFFWEIGRGGRGIRQIICMWVNVGRVAKV